jgi:proline iminopeptidase
VANGHPYPPIEPHATGSLDVGDGHSIGWEIAGDPAGRPALVLHGGPGSGCQPWHRELFDPARYRIVLFDQRGCGRSVPHASEPGADLSTNTTRNLLGDVERLRDHLGIERWLVWGGSWGSTLALAYAEAHPERVTHVILWGVTIGRRSELDWLFGGGLGQLLPRQWERLRRGVPEAPTDADVPRCYARRLHDPDPAIRHHAAIEWCMWESASLERRSEGHLDARFRDARFALAFARLVTHYVANDLFLEDGILLRNIAAVADIPAMLVNDRHDMQAPLGNAELLHAAWPGSELLIAEGAGHALGDEMTALLVNASDRFAR